MRPCSTGLSGRSCLEGGVAVADLEAGTDGGQPAVPDPTACTGCRECEKARCPQDAISFAQDGRVVINLECGIGCGIGKNKCSSGTIKIKQTFPMRADMHEYFDKEFNLNVKFGV